MESKGIENMLVKVNKMGFNLDNVTHWEESKGRFSLYFTGGKNINFWGEDAISLSYVLKPAFFEVCSPDTRMIDAVSFYKEIMELTE